MCSPVQYIIQSDILDMFICENLWRIIIVLEMCDFFFFCAQLVDYVSGDKGGAE